MYDMPWFQGVEESPPLLPEPPPRHPAKDMLTTMKAEKATRPRRCMDIASGSRSVSISHLRVRVTVPMERANERLG